MTSDYILVEVLSSKLTAQEILQGFQDLNDELGIGGTVYLEIKATGEYAKLVPFVDLPTCAVPWRGTGNKRMVAGREYCLIDLLDCPHDWTLYAYRREESIRLDYPEGTY